MRCLEAFTKFVVPSSHPPVLVMLVMVLARDLYLQAIKNYKSLTMSLGEARNPMAQQAEVKEA